jgi:hypothetical protein
MKRPWITGEDFHNFHWTKRTSSRRGQEKLREEEFVGVFFLCDFSWGGEEKDDESK